MSLINCKAELKLKWTNHHVLAVLGVENTNANDIFYYQKHKIICPCSHFISKDNQKLSKCLGKELERSLY